MKKQNNNINEKLCNTFNLTNIGSCGRGYSHRWCSAYVRFALVTTAVAANYAAIAAGIDVHIAAAVAAIHRPVPIFAFRSKFRRLMMMVMLRKILYCRRRRRRRRRSRWQIVVAVVNFEYIDVVADHVAVVVAVRLTHEVAVAGD